MVIVGPEALQRERLGRRIASTHRGLQWPVLLSRALGWEMLTSRCSR